MTLVVSLGTPDYVVQVSDRRLSVGGQPWAGGDANKSLFYCGHFVIGLAGQAFLPRPAGPANPVLSTDRWLSEQLVDASGTKGIEDLSLRLVEALKFVPAEEKDKKVAFVVAGWAYREGQEAVGYVPHVTVVSNYTTLHAPNWEPDGVTQPVVDTRPLSPGWPYMFFTIGVPMPNPMYLKLELRLATLATSPDNDPFKAVGIIVEGIREFASSDELVGNVVGQDLLATILPKKAIPGTQAWSPASGQPDPDKVCFLSLPEDGGAGVTYDPITVCDGVIGVPLPMASPALKGEEGAKRKDAD